jgi:hypothetical protein
VIRHLGENLGRAKGLNFEREIAKKNGRQGDSGWHMNIQEKNPNIQGICLGPRQIVDDHRNYLTSWV